MERKVASAESRGAELCGEGREAAAALGVEAFWRHGTLPPERGAVPFRAFSTPSIAASGNGRR